MGPVELVGRPLVSMSSHDEPEDDYCENCAKEERTNRRAYCGGGAQTGLRTASLSVYA
jgi:hypothetical protein